MYYSRHVKSINWEDILAVGGFCLNFGVNSKAKWSFLVHITGKAWKEKFQLL
jgi:hypothetical protein